MPASVPYLHYAMFMLLFYTGTILTGGSMKSGGHSVQGA